MSPKVSDVELLLAVVADIFEVKTLIRKSRLRDMVLGRQLVMKVMRERMYMKFTHIGHVFGFDHTTVLYSVDRINNLLSTGDDLAVKYYDLILNDHRLRHIMHEMDHRICILFPKHINVDAFMAHIRAKYPDVELD